MELPQSYQDKMKTLLKDNYEAYKKSFEVSRFYGLRVNTLKVTPKSFEKKAPFSLKPIPWTNNGYYYNKEDQPSKHPYYYGGLYYLQEPSAMTPAALLPIEKGDKVLDLCAAPGGKSTELGAKLQGTGVLVSNDLSASRAKALLRNIEGAGIWNTVITTESSEKLATYFEGYFDKILVDAPCSGEGMFRKEPSMIKSWASTDNSRYPIIQKSIIKDAAKMLKPGGLLLYSTCTFSPEENEGVIDYLLKTCPEFSVIPLPTYEGFEEGHPEWIEDGDKTLKHTVRLWPHKIQGEGHFLALLKKSDIVEVESHALISDYQLKVPADFEAFTQEHLKESFDRKRLLQVKQSLYYMPEDLPSLKGLRLLRTGLYLGELKKNRFEPSQALAMALTIDQVNASSLLPLKFKEDEDTIIRYLKGETFPYESSDGWKLVVMDEFPLGWGKSQKID